MFRIYVGNLPYAVRDDALKSFFADAGCKVKMATVPLTREGRSKGFGFVEFEDEESFKKAMDMNNNEMQGRPLRIDQARPREDRGGDMGSAPKPAPMPKEETVPMDESSEETDEEAATDEEADEADSDEDSDEDEA